jgi:hypothetical protein
MAKKNVPNGAYKTVAAAVRGCKHADEFIIYQSEYGYGWAAIGSETYDSIKTLGECDCQLIMLNGKPTALPGTGIAAKIIKVMVADPGGFF